MNANVKFIHEQLNRLDEKRTAAELISAGIGRQRRIVQAQMRSDADTMEQCRKEFKLLSRRRKFQRLDSGKIDLYFEVELAQTARRFEETKNNMEKKTCRSRTKRESIRTPN